MCSRWIVCVLYAATALAEQPPRSPSRKIGQEMAIPRHLQDGEEFPVLGDDEIVESADLFVFVVDNVAADQLAGAIPFRHERYVDLDHCDALGEHTARLNGEKTCDGDRPPACP